MASKQQPNQKSNNKNKKANNLLKRPILTLQKRNELSLIVTEIMNLGFKTCTNPKDEWDQYVKMQTLLKRVLELEAPLKRPTPNASASGRMTNIDAFYSWVNENGVKYDGVEIAQFAGYELGLQATRDITKGEELFSIPRKLLMSEENLEDDVMKVQLGKMTNLKLVYQLMLETFKAESFWKPYIDLLPESYNTVLYYTIDEMAELKGSNAFMQALKQCKAIARQYAFIYNTQQAIRYDRVTPVGAVMKEQFHYDLYRWACSTVMTRQNMIPRSDLNADIAPSLLEKGKDSISALIPFWDMANHRDGELTSFYSPSTQRMESSAQSDFKKGEQIFIYYGDRSNAELLLHNGFINPRNAKDSVSIKLGLSVTDQLYEKRSQLLDLLGIPKSGELNILPEPECISPELLAFVRIFKMDESQLDHWIESEHPKDLQHIDCALDTALEMGVWQFLTTRLMLLLRIFPTTLEDDEIELEAHRSGGDKARSHVSAMLLEFRILEKRMLKAALEYAQQRTKA